MLVAFYMVPATRSPTLRIAVIARAKVLPRVGTRWIAEASLRRSFYPISKTNTAFRRPVFKPKSRALNDIICPGLVLRHVAALRPYPVVFYGHPDHAGSGLKSRSLIRQQCIRHPRPRI